MMFSALLALIEPDAGRLRRPPDEVLNKLPDEHSIRAINLDEELGRDR